MMSVYHKCVVPLGVLWFCAFLVTCLESKISPVVINTWGSLKFQEANRQAFSILRSGGTALDAVEAGCTTCERLQCDGTVGYGGSPDEKAETTLDALIMDGRTMNVGAVAALRNIKDVVKVARRVLENTEHSFLVGSQATDFAVNMGFKQESLSTPDSKRMWSDWRSKNCQPNFWINVTPNPRIFCGPYHLKTVRATSHALTLRDRMYNFYQYNHDTIGMLAIDMENNIAVATSTNGAKYKIPGRVGDSSIIGSGGYAENGVGGAAATGDGDIMMRFLPSFKAVEALKRGLSPTAAAEEALANIDKYFPKYMGAVVVLSASGEYGAACHGLDIFPFSVTEYGSPMKVVQINCLEMFVADL